MSVSSNDVGQPIECQAQECSYRHKYTELLRHFNIQTSEIESLQRELHKLSSECAEKDETIKKLGDRLHDVRKENEANTVRASHRDELILSLRLELRHFYVAMAGILRQSDMPTREPPEFCELARCYEEVIKDVVKVLIEKWSSQELVNKLQRLVQHTSPEALDTQAMKSVSHEKFIHNLKSHIVSIILSELLPTPCPLDLSPLEPVSSSPEVANFTNRSQPRRHPLNNRQNRGIISKDAGTLSESARTPDCKGVAIVEDTRLRRQRGLSQATSRTLDMREPRVGQPTSRTRQQRDASLLPSHAPRGVKTEVTVLSPSLSGHMLKNMETPSIDSLKALPTMGRPQLNPAKSQRRRADGASGSRGKTSRAHTRPDTHRRSCPSRRPDEPQLAAEGNAVSLSPSIVESITTAADSPKPHESPDRQIMLTRRSGRGSQRGLNAPPSCTNYSRPSDGESGSAVIIAATSSRSSLPPTATHHFESARQQRSKGRSHSPIGGRTTGLVTGVVQPTLLSSPGGPRPASTRTSDYQGFASTSYHSSLGVLQDTCATANTTFLSRPQHAWAQSAKFKNYSDGMKWSSTEGCMTSKGFEFLQRSYK